MQIKPINSFFEDNLKQFIDIPEMPLQKFLAKDYFGGRDKDTPVRLRSLQVLPNRMPFKNNLIKIKEDILAQKVYSARNLDSSKSVVSQDDIIINRVSTNSVFDLIRG